jgi:hypothetical protein
MITGSGLNFSGSSWNLVEVECQSKVRSFGEFFQAIPWIVAEYQNPRADPFVRSEPRDIDPKV